MSCSAESNPAPSFYQWFDGEDDLILTGQIMVIPEECAGQYICVTCSVINEMKDGILGQGTKESCYFIRGK